MSAPSSAWQKVVTILSFSVLISDSSSGLGTTGSADGRQSAHRFQEGLPLARRIWLERQQLPEGSIPARLQIAEGERADLVPPPPEDPVIPHPCAARGRGSPPIPAAPG